MIFTSAYRSYKNTCIAKKEHFQTNPISTQTYVSTFTNTYKSQNEGGYYYYMTKKMEFSSNAVLALFHTKNVYPIAFLYDYCILSLIFQVPA